MYAEVSQLCLDMMNFWAKNGYEKLDFSGEETARTDLQTRIFDSLSRSSVFQTRMGKQTGYSHRRGIFGAE